MGSKRRKGAQRTEAAAARPRTSDAPRAVFVSLLLVALIWMVFGQTLHHDFVNYDDPSYVYENAMVTSGITPAGLRSAFSEPHARNWHPLTTISHMLDCELFGLKPGAHHAVNVLLHSAAAVLLLLVLARMTGAFWCSAFVAAVFAIHPLRAESVAWIAERKDVLSGFFFVLSLGAYHHFTRRRSVARYAVLAIAVVLGLMSKPMLVTLPVVLLLLDYWPLGRFSAPGVWTARSLIVEKLPLFALAALAGMATLLIQKTGGAMTESLPFGWRVANAFVSCIAYLRDLFWPAALAPFYPHPEGSISALATAGAVAAVVAITALAIWRRRENPYLLTGWLWYLCMLVPVVGIVSVGAQARADRYTYLPQIGVLIALTWAARDLTASWRYRTAVLGACAAAVIGLLAWQAHAQTARWRDSATLWAHTLAVTTDNDVAHNNVGDLHTRRGETEQALREYEKALEIRSRSRRGRYDFLLALYHSNVGTALQRKGAYAEAVRHYEQAIELQPDYAEAHLNLGGALAEQGKLDASIATYRNLLQMQPENAQAHSDLATVLLQSGAERDAVTHYEAALKIAPNAATPLNNLGWLLATSRDPAVRNPTRAVALVRRAIDASGEDAFLLHKLAASLAATGDFRKAEETAQRALQLANATGDAALAAELQRNLSVYRADRPLTEAGVR
jgi:protein O-mannosyl-transferase